MSSKICSAMDPATEQELYQLVAYARQQGLERAFRWIGTQIGREIKAGKAKRNTRRKTKVTLANGAEAWIDHELVREAAIERKR